MRREYFNVLRVVSAFAVVLLHSNEGIWIFSYDPYWFEATVITMVLFFAVPCFIMISGALLIDYSDHYSTITFIKKRVKKTLVPYVAWCLIGIVYLIFHGALNTNQLNMVTVIRMIINNEVLPIYWYLTELFAVYLITPVLTVIPKDKRKTTFEYIIISIFILNIMVPFIASSSKLGNMDVQMPLTTICLFYVTGYYLDRYLQLEKFKIVYMLGLVGGLILLVGTIVASYKAGSLVETYMGYTNFPCVLFSISVFCLFKQLVDIRKEGRNLFTQVVMLLVNETFGIYLVHWYVLNEIKVHLGLNYTDFMYRIPMGIAAFFISWLIVKILRMIPIVKHIVP